MTTQQLFRHLGARAAKEELSGPGSKRPPSETVKTVSSIERHGSTGLKPGVDETPKAGVSESVKPSAHARPFNWADESSFYQYGVSTQ